jgi:hypothetical protein
VWSKADRAVRLEQEEDKREMKRTGEERRGKRCSGWRLDVTSVAAHDGRRREDREVANESDGNRKKTAIGRILRK